MFNVLMIVRNWKQPRCSSVDELTVKMWCIYTMGEIGVAELNMEKRRKEREGGNREAELKLSVI